MPFGGVISYATLAAGDHTIRFTAETDPAALLTKTVSVEGNKAYSFFIIDKGERMDGLLISDNTDSYSSEKAFIQLLTCRQTHLQLICP